MPAKLSQEKVLERFRKIHGNSYDYSLVKYVGMHNNVRIICKKCNTVFTQTPDNHLEGKGCSKMCAKKTGSSRVKEKLERKKKKAVKEIEEVISLDEKRNEIIDSIFSLPNLKIELGRQNIYKGDEDTLHSDPVFDFTVDEIEKIKKKLKTFIKNKEIFISIVANKVQFSMRKEIGIRKLGQYVNLTGVSKKYIKDIENYFTEYLITHEIINTRLVESSVINQWDQQGRIYQVKKDDYGRYTKRKKVSLRKAAIARTNCLAACFPLIMCISKFFKKHKHNKEIVDKAVLEHSGKLVDYMIKVKKFNDILEEDINYYNDDTYFRNYLKQLEMLTNPVLLTSMRHGGKKRSLRYYGGLVSIHSDDDDDYFHLQIPPILIDLHLGLDKEYIIEKDIRYTHIPAPLTRIYSSFSHLRGYHYRALAWCFYQKKQTCNQIVTIDKLCHLWEIPGNSKNPKRMLNKLYSCLSHLVFSGFIYGYKTIENNRKVEFRINPFLIPEFKTT